MAGYEGAMARVQKSALREASCRRPASSDAVSGARPEAQHRFCVHSGIDARLLTKSLPYGGGSIKI